MPHHPSVYVISPPDVITHFDFWPQYDESASPNDSALYITMSNDNPPDDLMKNFASVTALDEPPSSGNDKSWNIWSCQRFIGSGGSSRVEQATPMHESDPLPK
jgi:hypothetical protein